MAVAALVRPEKSLLAMLCPSTVRLAPLRSDIRRGVDCCFASTTAAQRISLYAAGRRTAALTLASGRTALNGEQVSVTCACSLSQWAADSQQRRPRSARERMAGDRWQPAISMPALATPAISAALASEANRSMSRPISSVPPSSDRSNSTCLAIVCPPLLTGSASC